MNSCCDNYFEENILELNNNIFGQKEEISNLKRKLDSYDAVIGEKNEFQEIRNRLEQWKGNIFNENKKALAELLVAFNDQSEKLKQVAAEECKLQIKYNELRNSNSCLDEKLKALTTDANELQSKLAESEKSTKRVQKELCDTKEEASGNINEMIKTKKKLECAEEEVCKVRGQLDECTRERNRLNETKDTLEMDLKSAISKLAEEKLCACRAEEKFRLERETLSNELKTKCRKLSETELQCEEANNRMNDGKCKIKLLTASLREAKAATEKIDCEMKSRVRKMKEENCSKDDDIRRLNEQIKEFERENGGNKCAARTCDNSRKRCN